MPDPISSTSSAPNSSHYDPSECDPTRASCAPPPAPKQITLEPMVIEGRPPRSAPACERELKVAALGCSLGAASLVALALGKTSVLALPGLVSLVKEAASCAKLISDYELCKSDGAARIADANRCEADGGTAVAGVERNEVVCLEQP